MVYFVVFALVFVMNFFAMRQENQKLKNLLIITGFIVLLIFIGFRYDVGTDYGSYLEAYDKISDTPWDGLLSSRIEFLVALIFKACSFVLWDPKLVFVVLGFLSLWPIYRVNKLYDYKYLAYSVLTFCILFLPFDLNGMRQGIAMGFVLLSLAYLVKGNTKRSLVNFVVSVLFHTSSLIVLPHLIMVHICRCKQFNFTILNILLTSFIAAAVLFFLNDFLMSNGITQYNYMLGSVDANNISLKSIVVYMPIVLMLLLLKEAAEQKNETSVYKNLTLSGIALFAVGTAAQYLTRFGLFFMMPSIVLLPELVQSVSNKKNRIALKCAYIVYLGVFFYTQYYLFGRHDIVPYQTWLIGG